MNQNSKLIIMGMIIAVAIGASASTLNLDEIKDDTPRPELVDKNTSPSISSGPLTILNSEFKLGENVFLHIRGLKEGEAGKILFFTPKGKLYQSLPVDGSVKSEFNNYFKPDTTKTLGICKPTDLVGNWTVVFDGLGYKNIQFEVKDEFVLGGEADIKEIC